MRAPDSQAQRSVEIGLTRKKSLLKLLDHWKPQLQLSYFLECTTRYFESSLCGTNTGNMSRSKHRHDGMTSLVIKQTPCDIEPNADKPTLNTPSTLTLHVTRPSMSTRVFPLTLNVIWTRGRLATRTQPRKTPTIVYYNITNESRGSTKEHIRGFYSEKKNIPSCLY